MDPKITAAEVSEFLGITLQGMHKKLKSSSLNYTKTQNRLYFGHDTARQLLNLPFKTQTAAIQIVKGGTGKTSLTHSIAIRANLYGARVLCIDLDQQANLTQAFKIVSDELPVMVDIIKENMNIESSIVNISPGLDILPSRIENAVLDNVLMLGRHPLDRVYQDKISSLKNKYDLILIDCPPALGQSVAAVTLAVDTIIAPVTPEKFCFSGLKITCQEINNIEKQYNIKVNTKLILNKFDSRTSLSHEMLATLLKHPVYGQLMYKSYVRASQEFPNAIASGTSIFDTLRSTTAKEDIDLLTKEILDINPPSSTNVPLGKLEESEVTFS